MRIIFEGVINVKEALIDLLSRDQTLEWSAHVISFSTTPIDTRINNTTDKNGGIDSNFRRCYCFICELG